MPYRKLCPLCRGPWEECAPGPCRQSRRKLRRRSKVPCACGRLMRDDSTRCAVCYAQRATPQRLARLARERAAAADAAAWDALLALPPDDQIAVLLRRG